MEFGFSKHIEERKPIFDDNKHLPSVTFLFWDAPWGFGGGGWVEKEKTKKGGPKERPN
jgi:hypothetical protein